MSSKDKIKEFVNIIFPNAPSTPLQTLLEVPFGINFDTLEKRYSNFFSGLDLSLYIKNLPKEILFCGIAARIDDSTFDELIPFQVIHGPDKTEEKKAIADDIKSMMVAAVATKPALITTHDIWKKYPKLPMTIAFSMSKNGNGWSCSLSCPKGGLPKSQIDELENDLSTCGSFAYNFVETFLKYKDKFNNSISNTIFYFKIVSTQISRSGRGSSEISFIGTNQNVVDESLNENFSILIEIISIMRSRYFYDLNNRVSWQSTKSAIGSIMSRNGSHNIGSHVLAALTHHVGTMPDDRILYQYIQQRMDYIATVTTDFPSWGTATMFVGDMMKTFLSQHHLLEYISRSEELHAYKFQDPALGPEERKMQNDTIKLHIRRIGHNINLGGNNDKKPDWSLMDQAGDHALHFIRYIDYREDAPIPLEHDVALAIPGGVVGEHAFFTILENLIRNAAKHNWVPNRAQGKNLEIYIDFIDDPNADDIVFTVWDNMSDVFASMRMEDKTWDIDRCAEVISLLPDAKNSFDKLCCSAWTRYRKMSRLLCKLEPITPSTDEKEKKAAECLETLGQLKKLHAELITVCKDLKTLYEKSGSPSMQGSVPVAEKSLATFKDDIATIENKARNSDLFPNDISNLTDKFEHSDDIAPFAQMLQKKMHKIRFGQFLQTPPEKFEADEELRERLPLHWNLQLLLEQPLITEHGELRRQNWGLAEMRISAGYLQHRTVGQIGGLEDLPKGDHIILPVAVPGVCTSPNNENGGIRCPGNGKGCADPECPIRKNLYHLGYRFKVPKPREILIVLPKNYESLMKKLQAKSAELKRNGVYLAAEEENGICHYADDGRAVKSFKFDYVVFSDEKTAEKCGGRLAELNKNRADADANGQCDHDDWKAYLPFRLLYMDSDIDSLEWNDGTTPDIAKLKNAVYKAWLAKLKEEYGIADDTLSMQLQPEGKSGGGQGLITDLDLLRFVFRNNFHSVITNLLRAPELSDAPEGCRNILELLAYYPAPADEVPEEIGDDIRGEIARILHNLCDRLAENYDEFHRLANSKFADVQKGFAGSYWSRLKTDKSALDFVQANTPERFQIFLAAFTGTEDRTFNALDLLFGGDGGGADDPVLAEARMPVVKRLAKVLYAAYQTDDTLLRKYEERITTLPHGYAADAHSGERAKNSDLNKALKEVGIELVDTGSPLIKYCRHDKLRGEKTIYAEALSGSQSYLNTISRITRLSDNKAKENTGTFVRLAENALLDILIIDERVADFLNKHPDTKPTFEAMNISVVDVTGTTPAEVSDEEGNENIALERLPQLTLKKEKWSVLIIHQGVIDKWFSKHDKKAVGNLVRNLRNAVSRVVVTTGRGRPDNIPNFVKILPFSTIESTLFRNYPEKLLLTGTVMNILPAADPENGEHQE